MYGAHHDMHITVNDTGGSSPNAFYIYSHKELLGAIPAVGHP